MKMNVIVIPHAGGMVSAYYQFKKYNTDYFKFHFVELSGRGKRINEKLYDSFSEAVGDILYQIRDVICEGPYVILGHSMGSWLAYELYYRIIERQLPLPNHLFLSGNRSPFVKPDVSLIDYDDDRFIDYIVNNHAATKKIFEIEKLRNLFLPILRSDYTIMETYKPIMNRDKLSVDVSILGGTSDSLINRGFSDWEYLTEANIEFKKYQGNHFYIFDKFEAISDYMVQTLKL